MQSLRNTTDAERRQLVGLAAAGAATLLVATKILQYFTVSSEVTTFHDKLSLITQGDEVLGGFTVAAALLLMLDSERESALMKLAIVITGAIGALLMLVCVFDIASQFINYQPGSFNDQTFLVVYRLPQLLLGTTALWLTWPVLTNLRTPQTESGSADTDDQA